MIMEELRYEIEKKEQSYNGRSYEYKLVKPFPIFDMPPEIAGKLIDLAKEKYGNKAWLVIADLIEKDDLRKSIRYAQEKIMKLEDRVSKIESEKNGSI